MFAIRSRRKVRKNAKPFVLVPVSMGLLFFLSDVIQPIHSSCKYGLVPNR